MNEFEFLNALRTRYSLKRTGDDCAVLPLRDATDLLLTTDMLVENVDFRLAWTTPEFIGHKALAISLSDIAAMGGEPKWSMLSIGIPEHLWLSGFLDHFYEGWFALARKYNVELVGGDISRVPDRLVIDSTVGGEVEKGKAFLRSTAKPGDAIFLSGSLGAASAGLKLLETGNRYSPKRLTEASRLMLSQLQPQPQIELAVSLQTLGVITGAIDVSDGLSSDLSHICRESGVGAIVYQNLLPVDKGLPEYTAPDETLDLALNGGEDLGLLFTIDMSDLHRLEGLGVTRIGEITADQDKIVLVSGNRKIPISPQGFRHF
jgi:thiamine-monophosphate kinase